MPSKQLRRARAHRGLKCSREAGPPSHGKPLQPHGARLGCPPHDRSRIPARRARPFRPLRRHVRAGDADDAAARTGRRNTRRRRQDPEFQRELKFLLEEYAGRPTPLYFAERLTRATRRREDLSEARGPAPHRRAQDQQRARPDPARAAHGQEAHHRRDRRGPARRGHGDGRGACSGSKCVVYMGAVDWSGRR